MKGQEVIDAARIAFREATGGVLNLLPDPARAIVPFDLLIQVKLKQHAEVLLAEVKSEVRKQDIPQIADLFRKVITNYNQDKILIAQYIPGPVKDELKKLQINYLEAAGNCFINLEHLFIFVNDRKAAPARKTSDAKLWNRTGLKYVYAVLTEPEFLTLPFREQAARAGIALGNLTGLREELNQYLIADEDRKLNNPMREQLLERWALQYNHILKPTLGLGTFRFLKPEMMDNWKKLRLPKKAWWGGENAAAIITNYLRPQEFTIYTRNKMQVMVDLKLVPDENGNVHLYEPFWPIALDHTKPVYIDPIVVWAELNFELDQRLRETAVRIKEKINI